MSARNGQGKVQSGPSARRASTLGLRHLWPSEERRVHAARPAPGCWQVTTDHPAVRPSQYWDLVGRMASVPWALSDGLHTPDRQPLPELQGSGDRCVHEPRWSVLERRQGAFQAHARYIAGDDFVVPGHYVGWNNSSHPSWIFDIRHIKYVETTIRSNRKHGVS